MTLKLLTIAAGAFILTGCSQVSECHSDFSKQTLKELFAEQVDAFHASINKTPGYSELGLLQVSTQDFQVEPSTIVQGKIDAGYACTANLEVELKGISTDFHAENWLKPENRLDTLPMIALSQYSVTPFEDSKNEESRNVIEWGVRNHLEKEIVFKELIKSNEHDIFKIVGYEAGFDARSVNRDVNRAALSTSALISPVAIQLIGEMLQEDKLDSYLKKQNKLVIPVEYNLSTRKIDGQERDYLEIDSEATFNDGALLTYTLTSLSRLHAKGISVYKSIVDKYDTEEKRVDLFSRTRDKYNLYSQGANCGTPSSYSRYEMRNFKSDLQSGALRFTSENMFEVNGVTCDVNFKDVALMNELVLPGAALVAARSGTTPPVQQTTQAQEKEVNQEVPPQTMAAATRPETTSTPSGSEASQSTTSSSQSVDAQTTSPSFDCTKASTNVEKMICSDVQLSRADRALNDVYRAIAASQTDTSELRREMNAWRRSERDTCVNASCVLSAYTAKTEALAKRVNQ